MRQRVLSVALLGLGAILAMPAPGATIYNNLTPNDMIGIATRPGTAGSFEIEAGDDFVLTAQTIINMATFDGILGSPTDAAPTISDVVLEIYRVFPADSDVGRTSGPPTFSTAQVPTRVNSPSDVAFDSRDSAAGELTFSSSNLAKTFTVLNSVQPGGIHPMLTQTTMGNGPLTGEEVQISVNLSSTLDLPPDHYFFVPQVEVNNGGTFYWLSASRPISGAGTTPFPPGFTDLQAWTRDQFLDPDWLRVGTDIVGGGANAPTYNTAFALDGTVVPEPASIAAVAAGLALIGLRKRRTAVR